MSDILESLPVSEDPIPAQDYAKIHPYISKPACLSNNLRSYIILGALFLAFSLPFVDKTLEKLLKVNWIVVLLIKVALFLGLFYVISRIKTA